MNRYKGEKHLFLLISIKMWLYVPTCKMKYKLKFIKFCCFLSLNTWFFVCLFVLFCFGNRVPVANDSLELLVLLPSHLPSAKTIDV